MTEEKYYLNVKLRETPEEFPCKAHAADFFLTLRSPMHYKEVYELWSIKETRQRLLNYSQTMAIIRYR